MVIKLNLLFEEYLKKNHSGIPIFSIFHGMEMAWKILEVRFKILRVNVS